MKFKLDENLGSWAASPLLADGHDVCTVEAEGLCGRPDPAILIAAAREGRCLVTQDLEFANPFVFPPQSHRGVAALRVTKKTSKEEVLALLEVLRQGVLNPSLSQDPTTGEHPVDRRVWIVQHGRIRIYQGEA